MIAGWRDILRAISV